MTVCVFASSSSLIDNEYVKAAAGLGSLFAQSGMKVIYGGGGIGLMAALADAVIENGGSITGVIPSFMNDEGWGHPGVNDMIVTTDMGDRKKNMFARADAVVALPGGIGTLEELTEAITLKQLGLFTGPVVILNTLNFYRSLIDFLDHMVEGNFMRHEHKNMWSVANTPEEVIEAISNDKGWIDDPRKIAKI
ncbi:MAG TPA: TIGR00730 family Rossman fold protein [Bacteroidales bacterium]|nr:TIGR00730 family Rossman fold protein [Bacteroidales bacterium]HBZ19695.1 TIGR00730 family Rossman fold protein [Bacteroidales bacterium]